MLKTRTILSLLMFAQMELPVVLSEAIMLFLPLFVQTLAVTSRNLEQFETSYRLASVQYALFSLEEPTLNS